MGVPSIVRAGILTMQVCVPSTFTDDEVLAFAENKNPCGTSAGWQIRRQGDDALRGAPERRTCNDDPTHVHIMLDA